MNFHIQTFFFLLVLSSLPLQRHHCLSPGVLKPSEWKIMTNGFVKLVVLAHVIRKHCTHTNCMCKCVMFTCWHFVWLWWKFDIGCDICFICPNMRNILSNSTKFVVVCTKSQLRKPMALKEFHYWANFTTRRFLEEITVHC